MNAAVDVLRSIISYQNAQIWSASTSPKTFSVQFLRSIPEHLTSDDTRALRKITRKKKKKRSLINAVLNYYSMMSATLIKNWLGYRNSWL